MKNFHGLDRARGYGLKSMELQAKLTAFAVNIKRIAAILSSRKGSELDRKSTRLNSSHVKISYAVFCLKKKKRIKFDSYRNSSGPLPHTQGLRVDQII